MNLTDFWTGVPNLSDAALKEYAVVFPSLKAAEYLFGQDSKTQNMRSVTSLTPIQGGKYIMCADLLREFHPETATGLYDPIYADIISAIGDEITIEDWASSVVLVPATPPEPDADPESGDLVIEQWIQPMPGTDQWFNQGYPFGHRVRHTIDGTEYTMRSNINFNVWAPTMDARYWQPDPPVAVKWKAGQVWNIGDVVQHVSSTLPDNLYWKSKIAANTTEPNTDAGFYRYWEPLGNEYEPAPVAFLPGRAYAKGEQILHNGKVMISTYGGANIWSPDEYPTGWATVPGGG
jgi:hypothetical protein